MAFAMHQRAFIATVLAVIFACLTTTAYSESLESRQVSGSLLSPYAYQKAACPKEPLLRSGRGIGPAEQSYANKRKAKADVALKEFLARKGNFPTLNEYPMMAMSNCGGGIRGFLTSAGMHMAFDDKEGKNKYTTSGLFQAMTYESALSGSSIMLGSYVENNQPLTMEIYNSLWKGAMANGLFVPDGVTGVGPALLGITKDLLAKQAAGGPISAVDALGRLFGYVAYKNDAAGPAGVNKIFSDSITQSAYKNHDNPIPIFVALGLEKVAEGCGLPGKNASRYEFTPFEFGSFDKGIESFTTMKYLGSSLDNGKPKKGLLGNTCVTGFDNANFVVGTSTAVLNENCGKGGVDEANAALDKFGLRVIREIVDPIAGQSQTPLYSFIPNPAYNSPKSPLVKGLQNLMLIDGGENIQVIPDWPIMFRPDVKVHFMTDSSTYGLGKHRVNLPNGRSLYNSYKQAQKQGIAERFPKIPRAHVFLKKGLTRRPVFFGCNYPANDPAQTILYFPNRKYTYNSAVDTNKNKFTPQESLGLLLNGVQVATYGDDPQMGFCIACAVTKRAAEGEGKSLPSGCGDCFKKYCYN